MKSNEDQWQSMKIDETLWKTMKIKPNALSQKWKKMLAEQDDDRNYWLSRMMTGWWQDDAGRWQDDTGQWMMTGNTGWAGSWRDDGRMIRADGRMIRADGSMSRMTPGWCIIAADSRQLMTVSCKSFRRSESKCGQEATIRMIPGWLAGWWPGWFKTIML